MRRYVLPLLSIYLDLIIASAIAGFAGFLAQSAGLEQAGILIDGWGAWAAGALLVSILRMLHLSFGRWLLKPAGEVAENEERPRLWANLLLGTLLILDGLKQLVRWTQLDAVLPAFGLVETTPLKVATLIVMGGVCVAAGAAVLRLHTHGRLAALAAICLSALSLALSWRVLPEALARAQAARRKFQGLPIREGEIETMQTMFPAIAAGGLALFLILVWLTRTRAN